MTRPGILLLLLALTGCGTPSRPPIVTGPPTVGDRFILAPSMATAIGNADGGTAFAARLDGQDRPLIVTCRHIFGTACGRGTVGKLGFHINTDGLVVESL